MTMFTVAIGNTEQKIACGPDQTILHAAILAGIDYPYACASGNCGQCVSKLTEGTVDLLPRGDASLSPAQAEAGQTLACRARPRSDVAISWLGRGGR
jgi:ferredoxin-NAD(P)+ reductase (naphthalene dioxygenase ferredoxin-specific)